MLPLATVLEQKQAAITPIRCDVMAINDETVSNLTWARKQDTASIIPAAEATRTRMRQQGLVPEADAQMSSVARCLWHRLEEEARRGCWQEVKYCQSSPYRHSPPYRLLPADQFIMLAKQLAAASAESRVLFCNHGTAIEPYTASRPHCKINTLVF